MPNIARDEEVLTAIGLSEALVAQLLGKSRQAINHGLRQDDGIYFKDNELMNLLLWCRTHRRPAMPTLEDHIRKTRPKSSGDIISAYHNFSPLHEVTSADTIVLVLPGYRHFSQIYNSLAHSLRSAIARNPDKFEIVVSIQADRNAVISDVQQTAAIIGAKITADQINVAINPWSNALPFIAFCDFPDRLRVPFVLVGDRFEPIDGPRGEEIFDFLRQGAEGLIEMKQPKPPKAG